MNYDTVEHDFVCRTLDILQQYRTLVQPHVAESEQYEVTLLLNCLLGLIVVPFEHQKCKQEALAETRISEPVMCDGDARLISELDADWGLSNLNIETFIDHGDKVQAEKRTLRKIIAMFRHGMAHALFGDGGKQPRDLGLTVGYQTGKLDSRTSRIVQVSVKNQDKRRKLLFEASLPVEDLYTFATKLAMTYLEEVGRKCPPNAGDARSGEAHPDQPTLPSAPGTGSGDAV